jgi:hypothetical protein
MSSTPKSGLPKLYTLKEAVEAFGSEGITVRSLRREIYANRLKVIRSRPGRTARILIREDELLRWLDEEAGVRQFVR